VVEEGGSDYLLSEVAKGHVAQKTDEAIRLGRRSS